MKAVGKTFTVIFSLVSILLLGFVSASSRELNGRYLPAIYFLLNDNVPSISDFWVEKSDIKSFLDKVHNMKIDEDNSPLDSYLVPTQSDLEDFYMAARLLFKGDLVQAQMEFNKFGYELSYLDSSGQAIISLQEKKLDASGRFERGWGGALIPASAIFGSPVLSVDNDFPTISLQAPHTFFDSNSGEVARLMFTEFLSNDDFTDSYNVVYIFNTAFRYNSTTKSIANSSYRASDFARTPNTTGRMLNKALVDHTHEMGKSVIHVSIHGYSLDKRPQDIKDLQPTPNDVILGPDSTGVDFQSDYYPNLVDLLPGSYLCGANWPEDGGLCGNTDEMYRGLLVENEAENIVDAAIHLEIETERRKEENYIDFTAKLVESLLETLLEKE